MSLSYVDSESVGKYIVFSFFNHWIFFTDFVGFFKVIKDVQRNC